MSWSTVDVLAQGSASSGDNYSGDIWYFCLDKVGIRFVARRGEGMVSRRHGFVAIAQWDEEISARLAL